MSAMDLLRYSLTGTFVEACNCYVICPCWVEDTPDEAHCFGLFAWTFDKKSNIEGYDVGGKSVVSVTVHGTSRRGGNSESAIFVDDSLGKQAAELLIQAFSGKGGGPLDNLAQVTGNVLDTGQASITVSQQGKDWTISVQAGTTHLVNVKAQPTRFGGNAQPLTLRHTALSSELGTLDEAVTAHRAKRLTIDVAVLPSMPLNVTERSAMSGRFRYVNKRASGGGHEDE